MPPRLTFNANRSVFHAHSKAAPFGPSPALSMRRRRDEKGARGTAMTEQMRIHTDILEPTLAGTSALDDAELVLVKPGVVSYRCKVFRALLRSEERRVGKECRSRWWQ